MPPEPGRLKGAAERPGVGFEMDANAAAIRLAPYGKA